MGMSPFGGPTGVKSGRDSSVRVWHSFALGRRGRAPPEGSMDSGYRSGYEYMYAR